jgi:EAL domain-containing protein (putative c-di-GMP-specific phosphodiesterase class I)
MRTVAKGIEDTGTLGSLVEMGIDLGQGYLLTSCPVVTCCSGRNK